MSGTSVDAIDAALVRIIGTAPRLKAETLYHGETPWPKALRARISAIMAPASTSTQELCDLNALLAHHFAAAALQAIAGAKLPREAITAIACHGQTVCHLPPNAGRKGIASTLQLGDPSVIATLTGIQTVGNFRPADMAVGGQGAPLVPWADAALLSHKRLTRCVQNLGGIANVTYLPPLGSPSSILAFDTGPANMLMDAVISIATEGRQTFDRNGKIAAAGTLDGALFTKLQRHPYFKRRPPKSTGREDFGIAFAKDIQIQHPKLKIQDLLHTLTRLTAWSIADAYARFLPQKPDEVILCGGGADNPTLVSMIAEELSSAAPLIRRIDAFGIPNKAKEAASFALLAAATLDGVPANVPSVTGASRPVILGVIAK